MTDTTNGWPGKPGVPLNPEKDSEGHVWRIDGVVDIFKWIAAKQAYENAEQKWFLPEDIEWCFAVYHGRITPPDEAAALQARADQAAQGHAREADRADQSEFLHKQEIAALQKRVAELEGAVRTAAECIDADDTIAARGFLSDVLIKKHKPKWVCPNNTPGCLKNCGNYGCGN